MTEKMTGIEELRTIVGAMDQCRESFMDPFTAEEIVKIWRAWRACEFDIYPDQWSKRQVKEALRGIVPRFDSNEKPVYASAG